MNCTHIILEFKLEIYCSGMISGSLKHRTQSFRLWNLPFRFTPEFWLLRPTRRVEMGGTQSWSGGRDPPVPWGRRQRMRVANTTHWVSSPWRSSAAPDVSLSWSVSAPSYQSTGTRAQMASVNQYQIISDNILINSMEQRSLLNVNLLLVQ